MEKKVATLLLFAAIFAAVEGQRGRHLSKSCLTSRLVTVEPPVKGQLIGLLISFPNNNMFFNQHSTVAAITGCMYVY